MNERDGDRGVVRPGLTLPDDQRPRVALESPDAPSR